MLHPDADALFRAVLADPDDDTARLVYADWLQENGRPEEGERLRTECRLAATDPSDPEYPALLDRMEELRLWVDTFAPEPRAEFGGGLVADGVDAHRPGPVRAGGRFLVFDGDRSPGARAARPLAAALGRAFERSPARWLVLSFVSSELLLALLRQPVLAGLRGLTVHLHPGTQEEANGAVRALAECPHLRHLRGLSLAFPFGDPACAALAAAPWGGLESFSAEVADLSPVGLRVLTAAAWFRQLRELALDERAPAGTFEALCERPGMPRLHTLALAGGLMPVAAWEALAGSAALPALAELRCESQNLTGGRFEALAGAPWFTLRALRLNGCALDPGAAVALANAPWAPALRILQFAWTNLSPRDLRALAGSRRLNGMQHLDLSCNRRFGPAALAALAANPALRGLRSLQFQGYVDPVLTHDHFDRFLAKLNMPELRHLDLSGNLVGAAAAKRLADPKFASLRRLRLNSARVTDAAVAQLLAAPALQNLIQLDLDDNRLKSAPAALADRTVLPHLAACSLSRNKLPPAAVRKLRKRPGLIRV